MKKRLLAITVLAASSLSFGGCGANYEPISLLGGEGIPQLDLPLSFTYFQQIQPYVASDPNFDGLRFINTGILTSQSVSAPYSGLVTAADATSVTIYHTNRITTRLTDMTNVQRRVGDFLDRGAAVGVTQTSIAGATAVKLSVYLDGALICPYGFLNTTSQQTINSSYSTFFSGGVAPCR